MGARGSLILVESEEGGGQKIYILRFYVSRWMRTSK